MKITTEIPSTKSGHPRSLLIGILAVCTTITVFVRAAYAEVRWATVDVNRILNESKESRAKKKELDDLSLQAKTKIETKKKSLLALEKQLKDNHVAEDSKEAEKFTNESRNFNKFVHDTEDDLRKRFVKVNKEVTDKALGIISRYAEAHNLDLVLDKSEVMRGPVLFGVPNADITQSIIKDINKS